MADPEDLKPGTRVRLLSVSHVLTLRADTGYVVGPDKWGNYFIVRLDRPARYEDVEGERDEGWEISELAGNIEVIPSHLRSSAQSYRT